MDTSARERNLLAAILFQAIRDCRSPKHCKEAVAFFEGDGFSWLCQAITHTGLQIDRALQDAVKQRIVLGEIDLHAKPYHRQGRVKAMEVGQ